MKPQILKCHSLAKGGLTGAVRSAVWWHWLFLGLFALAWQAAAGPVTQTISIPGRINGNAGRVTSGGWLDYPLYVQTTAVYRAAFRVSPAKVAGRIRVSMDGLPLCAANTPLTDGGQSGQTIIVSNLVMTAGEHLLRLNFAVGARNLAYLQISKQGGFVGGFLRASGQRIVDAQGQNVILRGMGLGNWMVQEPYMMNVNGLAATQRQLKLRIAALVGADNMAAFYAAWLTNYITDADIAALAAAGFNSIRLPMHYDLFTRPVEAEPVPGQNTWLTHGFKLLDDLLASCEAHHIYLILDMHACPGGEGHDQPISDYNPPAPSLWESAANRAKLVALWHELAARYANQTWIGGYDLINEPNWTFEDRGNLNGRDDQTNAPLRRMFRELTAAIRQVDTNHMIIIEGNGWAGNYQGLLPPWDDNLVISFHKYWDQPTAASLQPWVDKRDQWNLPLWLGESGENSNDWFRDVVQAAERSNIGWSWWPWKKIGTITGPVMIQKPAAYEAILNYWNGTGPRPTTNDAFQGLLALARAARYENCVKHLDVIDALMRPTPGGITLPFKTNFVPGVIFAANYDLGRSGEAYLKQTASPRHNNGGVYRNDAVGIEVNHDSAQTTGYDVGWLDPGDWMKYTVLIPSGPYAIWPRVAAPSAGGLFHLEMGGKVVALIHVPATGGWQTWATLAPQFFTNTFPASSFRVVVDTGGFNLNWLKFISLAPVPPAGQGNTSDRSRIRPDWNHVAGRINRNLIGAFTKGGASAPANPD